MARAFDSLPQSSATGLATSADYPALNQSYCASLARQPEAPLFRSIHGWSVSYREAGSRAATTADYLGGLGLGAGDKLICYLDDTVALGVCYLACASRRVLAAPLSPSFSITQLLAMSEQLGTSVVLTTPERATEVRGAGMVPVSMAGPGGASSDGVIPCIDGLNAQAVADAIGADSTLTGADPLLLQPTSGSTGKPKQVVRRHAALARYARFVGAELGSGSHRFLAVAALTHAFGCHMFATAVSLGAELLLCAELDAGASLLEVRQLDPTVLPMTPRVLRAMCRQYVYRAAVDPEEPFFGPSAEFLLSAGGRSDNRLLRFVVEQGMRVIEFYGSSEASLVALTPSDGWREGWAGRVVDDVDVRLAPDSEVLVASAGMMSGYLDEPELTAAAYDADGYYQTGDLGELSSDGYLRILGRKKDVFNTPEGSNIHPERIEVLLEGLTWAGQVMLVGDQLPYLTALIALHPDSRLGDTSRPDGLIWPDDQEAFYRRCAADLESLNEQLEGIERVRAFLLFDQDFGEDVYCIVGPAKARRTRPALLHRFAEPVAWLYAYERLADPSPAIVTRAEEVERPHRFLG